MLRQLEASAVCIVAQSRARPLRDPTACAMLSWVCHGFKPQFKEGSGAPRLPSATSITPREIPCQLMHYLHGAIF
jgi:hypothetical protein